MGRQCIESGQKETAGAGTLASLCQGRVIRRDYSARYFVASVPSDKRKAITPTRTPYFPLKAITFRVTLHEGGGIYALSWPWNWPHRVEGYGLFHVMIDRVDKLLLASALHSSVPPYPPDKSCRGNESGGGGNTRRRNYLLKWRRLCRGRVGKKEGSPTKDDQQRARKNRNVLHNVLERKRSYLSCQFNQLGRLRAGSPHSQGENPPRPFDSAQDRR